MSKSFLATFSSSVFLFVSCGGGGGGGGGPTSELTPALNVDVLEEVTFLSELNGDLRTVHLIQFRLSSSDGGPVADLPDTAFDFERDGVPASRENLTVPKGRLAKVNVALLLDNSSSLLEDESGNLTDVNVNTLRNSAIQFIEDIVDRIITLRIYKFSTTSRTARVGEYSTQEDATAAQGFRYNPDTITGRLPQDDIRASINPSDTDDRGTALFQALLMALEDDVNQEFLIVLFSDGNEEGSEAGSEEAALAILEREQSQIFSLGVGNVVNKEDFRKISRYGRFIFTEFFDGVEALFKEITREVQSIYTVTHNAPLQAGEFNLTLLVEDLDGNLAAYDTSFIAGIDLIENSYVLPSVPGSVSIVGVTAQYELFESDGISRLITKTVLPLIEGESNEEGIFHFAISNVEGENVSGISKVAVLGEGGGRFLPASPPEFVLVDREIEIGVTWHNFTEGDGSQSNRYEVVRFEPLTVSGETYDTVVIEVENADGALMRTEWWSKGIGLVKQEDEFQFVTQSIVGRPQLTR